MKGKENKGLRMRGRKEGESRKIINISDLGAGSHTRTVSFYSRYPCISK